MLYFAFMSNFDFDSAVAEGTYMRYGRLEFGLGDSERGGAEQTCRDAG